MCAFGRVISLLGIFPSFDRCLLTCPSVLSPKQGARELVMSETNIVLPLKARSAGEGQFSLKCLRRDRVRSPAKELLSWVVSTSPVLSSHVTLGRSLYLSKADESSPPVSKSKELTPIEELALKAGFTLPTGSMVVTSSKLR